MAAVLVFVLAVLVLVLVRARSRELSDGVPDAPIELRDDEVGHRRDGTVIVRQSSARLVTRSPRTRLARGSVPMPFARVIAGELVIPERRRPPSVA